ncbi:DNA polymerase [Amaricoccus macauensis]|uniref:Type-4 uracil-DNA glycosylase n=1 Tax=Amaricoccus macauensis TaxID=57001 RepID=A0A840SSJ3_9RHOB|nr:DNA polymerase [Amaricoccus macauensis]
MALHDGADLDGFRAAVRRLIAAGARPEEVVFASGSLFAAAPETDAPAVMLPRRVADLVRLVTCHRDPERYALLYALIWRMHSGEKHLLDVASDPLVYRLQRLAKSVRRDLHKMHAFVRFRRIETPDGERFIAWFEPENFILEATADFFITRFRSMDWAILTPIGRMRWDRTRLSYGPPASRDEAPVADPFEDGWRGYYESTFNPARVNLAATRAEMPKKYWKNLPEAAAIPEMIRNAPARVKEMIQREATRPAHRKPEKALAAMADQTPNSLDALNRIIASAPPMVEGGTRAVLGEGPLGAAIAFVGEQPGDQEDLAGRPFVGPAGQVFDKALEKAGIDRAGVYVTNAVKHFKYVQRGKRRLHQRPTAGEVKHYRWWLKAELDFVGPRVIVAMGATAVLALTGKALPVTSNRGETRFDNRAGYITVHPSHLLRLPDEAAKRREWDAFVADMRRIREIA